MNTTSTAVVELSIEVITLPVAMSSERSGSNQVGFTLDVDYSPNDAFRVVQLTLPGFPGDLSRRRAHAPVRRQR